MRSQGTRAMGLYIFWGRGFGKIRLPLDPLPNEANYPNLVDSRFYLGLFKFFSSLGSKFSKCELKIFHILSIFSRKLKKFLQFEGHFQCSCLSPLMNNSFDTLLILPDNMFLPPSFSRDLQNSSTFKEEKV